MAFNEPFSTLELGSPTAEGQIPVAEEHPPAYFDNIPSTSAALPSPGSRRPEVQSPKVDLLENVPSSSIFPSVDFAKYAIPGSELSKDQTTQTIYSSLLSSDPHELELFIQDHIPLPPLLQINIVGKIKDKVMFDIKCNMLGLIHRDTPPAFSYVQVIEDGDNGYRGSSEPSVTPHPLLGGVVGWCRQFCEDAAPHKRWAPSSISTITCFPEFYQMLSLDL